MLAGQHMKGGYYLEVKVKIIINMLQVFNTKEDALEKP